MVVPGHNARTTVIAVAWRFSLQRKVLAKGVNDPPEKMNVYDSEKLSNEFDEVKSLDDLSTDGQTMYELMTLVVDIKYRRRYGESIEYQKGTGYSNNSNNNKALAGPLSPVDDALPGA